MSNWLIKSFKRPPTPPHPMCSSISLLTGVKLGNLLSPSLTEKGGINVARYNECRLRRFLRVESSVRIAAGTYPTLQPSSLSPSSDCSPLEGKFFFGKVHSRFPFDLLPQVSWRWCSSWLLLWRSRTERSTSAACCGPAAWAPSPTTGGSTTKRR